MFDYFHSGVMEQFSCLPTESRYLLKLTMYFYYYRILPNLFQNTITLLNPFFSLLTGWGLNKAETGEWEQTEKLKLKTLQVSPKSLCAFRFSREELKKKGVSFFQIKRQLTVGFTNDVSCVGNDFKEKVM